MSLIISLIFIQTKTQQSDVALHLIEACDFVGELFLNALKMIVVPLIVSSIVSGMLGLGGDRNFGRMGLKTLLYYVGSTLVAVLVGLLCVNIVRPGNVSPELAERMLSQADKGDAYSARMESITESIGSYSGSDFLRIFTRMVPTNVISAASDNGQILGVICFSLLFGFFISRLKPEQKAFQETLWQSILNIMMMIADLIIMFAPIGVFALVTPKLMETGVEVIIPVSKFFLTTLLALFIQFAGVLSLVLYFIGKVNPWHHYQAMSPALLTAFSTASSVSTLPITMDCVEHRAGISNRVASFTLPLGATVNMNGTALYECMVVIFISQFYGVVNPGFSMSLADQFMVVLLTVVTSIGVAGIPSASLVAIAVILGAVGLPLEYIGIVLVVDRILDMCRSAVNIYSDTVGAVIIARSEGETPVYREDYAFNKQS